MSVDSGEKEQCRLASIHFALLVDCLKTAHIWSRVTELHCSCERWLGPVRHSLVIHVLGFGTLNP